jgi:hypothetical protein
MDDLGVSYEYEPEGFTDGTLCYLPDFWLPNMECYLEVKPTTPTDEEYEKALLVVEKTKKSLVFMVGAPHMPDPNEIVCRYGRPNFLFFSSEGSTVYRSKGFYWASCAHCKRIGFGEFDRYGLMLCHNTLCEWAEQGMCGAIRRAVLASLNFKFGATA